MRREIINRVEDTHCLFQNTVLGNPLQKETLKGIKPVKV